MTAPELLKRKAASLRRAGSRATRPGNALLLKTRPPNGVLAAQLCGEFSGGVPAAQYKKKEPSAVDCAEGSEKADQYLRFSSVS
jgi:hypothetical protein